LQNTVPTIPFTRRIMRRVSVAILVLAFPAAAAGQAGVPRQASLSQSDPAAERRVDSLLKLMTLDEKIRLIAGTNGFDLHGLARLGIPQLSAGDSPFGIRASGPATLYAGGINLAATWNTELATQVGAEIGRDARARGKQYLLGPGVNMYRSPLSGRNFEYYGEDPFLAARTAVAFIKGVQSERVSATIKHFMGNNSEFARNTTDSRIDERTKREIYLPAFEAAVKEARVGAIMGSYNLTDGLYMTANPAMNIDLVKKEWGFDGVMMSDWYAVHDALGAVNGGTDLEMPEPLYFNHRTLLPAISEGKVAEATIDDKIRRLLRNAVRFGWMDNGAAPDLTVPRYNLKGKEIALRSAREGMVLLRNVGLLPLNAERTRTIAVIGPNAHPAVVLGGGSAAIPTYSTVSALQGIAQLAAPGTTVHHARGIPTYGRVTLDTKFTTTPDSGAPGVTLELFRGKEMTGAPVVTRVEQRVALGAPLDLATLAREDFQLDPPLYSGPEGPMTSRWTGYYTAIQRGVYDFVVQQGGFNEAGYRLYVDGKLVADRWKLAPAVLEAIQMPLDSGAHKVVIEQHAIGGFSSPVLRFGIRRHGTWVDSAAVAVARSADVVVLAVGFDANSETENWDRTFRLPPGQEELVAAVSAANPRTIVVVNSGGAVDMREWIGRVPAVLQAWYPGQEGGTALGELLFGIANPSGRLPVTFEWRWEDNPAFASYYPDSGSNRIYYREGMFVGYRGFEQRGKTPLFPFGFGLSYTTFRMANLAVRSAEGSTESAPRWTVTFDVTNTGEREGAAVPQVYVGERHPRVPRPRKELKGFSKVPLKPGETRSVSVPLDARSLAYYDVAGAQWRVDPDLYEIMVGWSSADADIVLRAPLAVRRLVTLKVRP
jgi:beta-glucosidase